METLIKRPEGLAAGLTRGREERASLCLAKSQAATVHVPIHSVLCVPRKPSRTSSPEDVGQQCRILSAKGSSAWLWGRKPALPARGKALGLPAPGPAGHRCPGQAGLGALVSPGLVCALQWRVMMVVTTFSTHLCQGNSPHTIPISIIPRKGHVPQLPAPETLLFCVTAGRTHISDPAVAEEQDPVPAPPDTDPPVHSPIPMAHALLASALGGRISHQRCHEAQCCCGALLMPGRAPGTTEPCGAALLGGSSQHPYPAARGKD